MASKIHRSGMWDIPYKATNVICPDGKRRNVKLTRDADTFFTIPAALTYKGKTVSGFVSQQSDRPWLGDDDDLEFTATGKNAYLFNDDPAVKMYQTERAWNRDYAHASRIAADAPIYALARLVTGKWDADIDVLF